MFIKFIGKRSVLYTLSKIISAVFSLLSISLFTRIFDADIYGQYLLFVSYVTLICSLFFWWHRLSTYRYYHKYKEYYDSFLKTSYLSFFLIISVIIILSLVLYNFQFLHQYNIITLLPFCVLAAIFKSNFDLNQSLFNISRRDYLFCLNIVLRPVIFVTLSLIFHNYFKIYDFALIYSLILSFLITAIASNFLIFKKNTSGKYEKKIISKFFSYGFPLTGLFIFDYILTFSDRLLIGHYLGSDMVGMYGANYDLIKMMVLFGMIIQGYIIYPELNKTFEKNDLNEVKKLMTFNFNIFITVFLPLCVFILYFNNSISDIFIGKKFTIMSSELIPLFSMMFLFWGLKIHHFDYIFQLSEKTSLSMYVLFFGSFINLLLNIFLIPRVELLGAAYATFASYIIILLISLLISRKLLKVSIDIKILIKTGLFLVIGLIISKVFSMLGFNDFISMAIFISCYGVLTFKYNYKDLKHYFIKLYF